MQRFEFSLETLLTIRVRKEDDAKQNLADKEQELREAFSRIEEAHNNIVDFQNEQKEARTKGQSVLELRNSVSWNHTLRKRLLESEKEAQEIQIDIARAKQLLIEATKEKKSIEILKENKYEEWKKEYNKKEQLFLDELSQNRFIREHREDS